MSPTSRTFRCFPLLSTFAALCLAVCSGRRADAAAYTPLQGAPYSERLPLVHQLDLRVEKNWRLSDISLTFYIDLWNAYNHPADEQIAYNFDFSRRSYQQGLPILPSLGFRGEF